MKREIPICRLGGLLLLLVASLAMADGEPATAPQPTSEAETEARAALEKAEADLADVDRRMKKLKAELEVAYRTLDDANHRRHGADSTESRASLDELKNSRLDLDAERDRSLLRVDLQRANLEVVQSSARIDELEAAGSDTRSETKKRDRAQKRVLKLTKTLEQIQ